MPERPRTAGSKPKSRYNLTSRFAAECGLRGPLRLMVENTEESQSQTFDVHEPFLLIGRAHGCHLRLLHSDVSYRHAYCQVIQGRLYVFDLESKHGVAWGEGLRHEGVLTPQNRLQIGPFIIRLSRAPVFMRSLEPTSEDWELENEPLENIRLWFENAAGRRSGSAMRPLRRQITIMGRANCCHLKLSDSSVSKAHCAVVRTAVGSWIVDLLGRSGTKLNDQKTRFAPIAPSDRITAGRFRLAIREIVDDGNNEEVVHPPTSHEPHPDSEFEIPVVAAENPVKEAASLTMPPMDEESLNQARQQLSIHAAQLPASREGAVAGASDPLILAMMEQFSHLQQQLLAHTEQQMSMLTEMFSTLHKAQNDAVVEQLQQIQSITSELNELKAERRAANADAAAEQKADAANVSSSEQDTPVRAAGRPDQAPPEPVADAQQNAKVPHSGDLQPPENSDAAKSQEAGRFAVSAAGEDASIDATIDEYSPAEQPDELPNAANSEDSLLQHDVPDDDSDVVPVAPGVAPAEASPFEADAVTVDDAILEPAEPPDQSPFAKRHAHLKSGGHARQSPDAHARLTTRISELERERNSRWKRLMQLVSNAQEE